MNDVEIIASPIDYAPLVECARSRRSGAVVLFLGTVRELSEGKAVARLEYEAHISMARTQLGELLAQARRRWSLDHASVVHRHGKLELGDVAVAVVTASAHRAEAFAAAGWLMDEIKRVVPIWKKEFWADGSAEWVHPQTSDSAESPAGT
jgi:molybdopterin synthase catalytic subunit